MRRRSAFDLLAPLSFGRVGYALREGGFGADASGDELHGRHVLVTGATSGIGAAVARAVAASGAKLTMLVRSEPRGAQMASAIEAEHPGADPRVEVVDLARLSSVRSFLERFRGQPVDVLVQNAGVLPDALSSTEEGLELTWATNVVGPFALTAGLLEPLRASSRGRVITVSSGGMYLRRLQLDDLSYEHHRWSGVDAYANTKRAQVILNELWAEREPRIEFHAMHPGWADTPGVETSLPRFHRWMRPLLRTAEAGADTVVWLAGTNETAGRSGGFWFDRAPVPTHLFPWTKETAADRQALWARVTADAAR